MRGLERRISELEARVGAAEPKGRPILTEADFIAAVKEAEGNFESINLDDTPEPLLRRIHDLLKEAQNEAF